MWDTWYRRLHTCIYKHLLFFVSYTFIVYLYIYILHFSVVCSFAFVSLNIIFRLADHWTSISRRNASYSVTCCACQRHGWLALAWEMLRQCAGSCLCYLLSRTLRARYGRLIIGQQDLLLELYSSNVLKLLLFLRMFGFGRSTVYVASGRPLYERVVWECKEVS